MERDLSFASLAYNILYHQMNNTNLSERMLLVYISARFLRGLHRTPRTLRVSLAYYMCHGRMHICGERLSA